MLYNHIKLCNKNRSCLTIQVGETIPVIGMEAALSLLSNENEINNIYYRTLYHIVHINVLLVFYHIYHIGHSREADKEIHMNRLVI